MIFNLFKSKPTLKELIPDGFVDIHSHILPGIDDGAKNIEESLLLISEMKKLNFSKIIGTPHTYPGLYDNTNNDIKKSYNLIKGKIDDKIKLSYASEYMLDQQVIKKSEEKTLLALKDNFVLVEMSFFSEPNNLFEIIFKMRLNDYVPVLAHPERYLFFENKFNQFYKLKKHGCLFQTNILSAVGYYGQSTTKLLDKLLSNKLIDFIGSDFHNLNQIKYCDAPAKISYNNLKRFEAAAENNFKNFK